MQGTTGEYEYDDSLLLSEDKEKVRPGSGLAQISYTQNLLFTHTHGMSRVEIIACNIIANYIKYSFLPDWRISTHVFSEMPHGLWIARGAGSWSTEVPQHRYLIHYKSTEIEPI